VEVEVNVKSLEVGDVAIGHTGEFIPVDGRIVMGEAMVNQSAITGELLPVPLKKGDQVFAGSIVEEGKIKVEVEKVGEETTLARMGKFITTALKRPAPFQRKSEVLANKLVPVTFALGTGTFFLTKNLAQTASVFSVDYSCALKLSAPIALRASMYRAAKEGVIIRDGRAWESLSQVSTFVFDKTGTLTQRHPQLSKIVPLSRISPQKILSLAATAEAPYSHPLAKALCEEANKREIELLPHSLTEFTVAHGVSAFIKGKEILVGNRHFLGEDMGIDCGKAHAKEKELLMAGKVLLYVAQEKKLIGLLALKETLRPGTKEVVKNLKEKGIKRIIMLTGDHRETALAVGRELGIEEVKWELLPEEKAKIIQSLKKKGEKIAFVGDGVNDAPALISADVGICLREGTTLARETASVVLQKEDLRLLPWAYSFSKKAIKQIRENFYLTVGLNSAILSLALFKKISPLLASIFHNSTTVGILLRCLSLREEEK
jgi:Cu2+-exporting ATPase